jgi:hypothetical protein
MIVWKRSARQQTLQRLIADAVHFEEVPDLFQVAVVCQQLFPCWKVHTVEAWKPNRWTTHPHVDFLRAGSPQSSDFASCGRPANDRIVHHYYAFVSHNFVDYCQFEFNFQFS